MPATGCPTAFPAKSQGQAPIAESLIAPGAAA
jgi:hypothetical protein